MPPSPHRPDTRDEMATELARWRDLVEHSTDWVWEVDAQGVYTYASPRICELLGYEPEEVVGRTPFDLMAPGEADRIGATFAAIVAERRPFALLENVNVHRDGHFVLLETSGVPLLDEHGALVGFRGIDRDVTARKAAEDGLLRFRWLAETTGDGVVAVSRADGRVTHANPAADILFGCEVGTGVTGRPLAELLPSSAVAVVLCPEGPGGRRSTRLDTTLLRDDRGWLSVELLAGLSATGDEVLLLLRDLTRQSRRVAVDDLEATAARMALTGDSAGTMLQEVVKGIVVSYDLIRATFRVGGADGEPPIEALGGRSGPGTCTTFSLGAPELGTLEVEADAVTRFDSFAVDQLVRLASATGTALVALRQRQRILLFESALAEAANAVMICERDGRIIWVNRAFTALSGYTSEQIVGANPRVLKSGLQPEAVYREFWTTLLSGQPWHGELHNQRRSGEVYPEEMTVTPIRAEGREITHFIAVKSDISDRRRRYAQIVWLASHDGLTNLPNRSAMVENIGRVAAQARRGRPGALAFLDIDWFKVVNDTMGHAAGDALLVAVAGLLTAAVRPEDAVARVGGDEFAILLEGVSLAEAANAMGRVQEAMRSFTFHWAGHANQIGLSIGVVAIDGTLDPSTLFARADMAMFTGKLQGRGRIVILDTEQEVLDATVALEETTTRITSALQDGRASLVYQPVIRLADGQVEFVEGLLRVTDPEGRLLSTTNYITTAERLGLAERVDVWVLDAAMAVLDANPGPPLFINVATSSLTSPLWGTHLEGSLDTGRIPPGRLGLEVSEAAAVAHLGQTGGILRRLAARGVRLAIDNFGSGEASILNLQSLPVEYVKIDASLQRSLHKDPATQAVVQAIVMGAVEHGSDLAALQGLGVLFAQGYALGRPDVEWPRAVAVS